MIYPTMLYDNIARDGGVTLTYSGATTAGFEPANTIDWRDFSLFLTEAGTTTLDYTMVQDRALDTASIFIAQDVIGEIQFQAELTTSVFTTVGTFVNPSASVLMAKFDEVTIPLGNRLRVRFVGLSQGLLVRQVVAGVSLVPPIGQRGGLTPPNLAGGVIRENTISVNGSILGTTIRREDRKTTLMLDNLSEDFVRTEWEAFAKHSEKYPFIYAWNFDQYPLEVSMAAVDGSVPAAKNMDRPQHMSVEWKLRNLVD